MVLKKCLKCTLSNKRKTKLHWYKISGINFVVFHHTDVKITFSDLHHNFLCNAKTLLVTFRSCSDAFFSKKECETYWLYNFNCLIFLYLNKNNYFNKYNLNWFYTLKAISYHTSNIALFNKVSHITFFFQYLTSLVQTVFSIALHLNLPLTGNFMHFLKKKNSFCKIYKLVCPWRPQFRSPQWHESPGVCVYSGLSPHRHTHTHTSTGSEPSSPVLGGT